MSDDAANEQGVVTDSRPVPLSRNRNYHILWSSLLFSELTGSIVSIAFPLLILAVSGSAFQLSLVAAVLATARMVSNVPAGVIADRWDRKNVMLTCQCVRAVAMTCLALALALDGYSLALVLGVAAVEGVVGSVFAPAEDAALPQVVHASQLAGAVARNTARPHIANLLGPVLTGFLFGIGPMLPFALNVVFLAGSFAALVFLVLPRRRAPEAAATSRPSVRGDIGAGFRWVLGNRILRTTLLWLVFNQLFFSALVIIVLAAAGERSVGAGETGLMMACFGAGGILGAMAASKMLELLPSSVIVVGFSWVGALMTALMAVVSTGLPLGIVLGCTAFFVPAAATTIMTYQMMVTPDEFRGRLSGIVGLCTGGANALGPLVGGLLTMVSGDSSSSLLLCAASLGVVALGSLLSGTLRRFPPLRDSAATSAEEPPAAAG